MNERKLIRTKFFSNPDALENALEPENRSTKHITVYEYQDGSRDASYRSIVDRTVTVAQTGDIFVPRAETPKIPPLIKRRENEASSKGIVVEGVRVEMESKLNEFTREITARYIKEHDGISQKELAETFGTDQSTTNRILQSLIKEGRIIKGGDRAIKKGGGRPVRELHYNPDYQEAKDRKSTEELVRLKGKKVFGNILERNIDQVEEFIQNNPGTSRTEIFKEFGFSPATAGRLVKSLIAEGKIIRGDDKPLPKGKVGRPERSLLPNPEFGKEK